MDVNFLSNYELVNYIISLFDDQIDVYSMSAEEYLMLENRL